jgi:hypothetical protein
LTERCRADAFEFLSNLIGKSYDSIVRKPCRNRSRFQLLEATNLLKLPLDISRILDFYFNFFNDFAVFTPVEPQTIHQCLIGDSLPPQQLCCRARAGDVIDHCRRQPSTHFLCHARPHILESMDFFVNLAALETEFCVDIVRNQSDLTGGLRQAKIRIAMT